MPNVSDLEARIRKIEERNKRWRRFRKLWEKYLKNSPQTAPVLTFFQLKV